MFKNYCKARVEDQKMFQELIVSIIVISVFFYSFKYLKDLHRYYSLLFKLPSPKWTPFLGHLPEILCDGALVLKKLRKWSREFGPAYMVSVFYYAVAEISGPEEFEIITSSVKHSRKADLYNLLHRWLGQGLLTSSGSLWQVRRKILTPAFHFSILRDFVDVFNEETDKLVTKLRQETGKSVNVLPLVSQCTLSAIVETAMGSKLNLQNATDNNYVKAIHEFGKLIFHKLIRPWTRNFFYRLTPTGFLETKLIKTINIFTHKVIKIREKEFEKIEEIAGEDSDGSSTSTGRKKLVMLDLLLDAKLTTGIIDDKGIEDEVNTIMFEGHDTTATAICFLLMLLACHRDIQDLVYEEIIKKSAKGQKHFSMRELIDLKYMECVIKESLRLYPSVPSIARKLDEDITTPAGYKIPGKVDAHLHIFDIHRNPKYWPDPEKFDPHRFLQENCVNRHPFAYVPFSAGPRNCIGQRYAMLEIKSVLSGILRNFILEPIDTPESIVVVPDLVLRPENNCLLVKFGNRT